MMKKTYSRQIINYIQAVRDKVKQEILTLGDIEYNIITKTNNRKYVT